MVLETIDSPQIGINDLSPLERESSEIKFDPKKELSEEDWLLETSTLNSLRDRDVRTFVEKAVEMKALFQERRGELPFGENDIDWIKTHISGWHLNHLGGTIEVAEALILFPGRVDIKQAFPDLMHSGELVGGMDVGLKDTAHEAFLHYFCWKVLYPDDSVGKMSDELFEEFKHELDERKLRAKSNNYVWVPMAGTWAEAKIMFPEKFDEIAPTISEWQEMKKRFDEQGDQGLNKVAIALNMTIIASQKTEITPEGYKITPKAPSISTDKVQAPEERSF